jgi:hypothetical protein
MAVLLQYNDNDLLSLDELAIATNIRKDLLTQVLQPLVKSRILIRFRVDEGVDQYYINPSMFYFRMGWCATFY